uniref:SH2 domain-containing protein n=1 Tax=Ditylenchus dipsaci TaxID=166011 RepID=A0A915DNG7_9BILA
MENERTPSSSSCSLSLQSCSLNEAMPLSGKWYWGKVDKEAVSAAMENQPDGTFCVRDASSPGDYTLTLKVGGCNKLIKIIVSNGNCGFTPDTLEFSSILQLVEYYKKHSLKDFNEKLDTCLLYPLSNPACRPSLTESPRSIRHIQDSPKDVLPVVKCSLLKSSASEEFSGYEQQLLKTNLELQQSRMEDISKAKQLMSIALKNLEKTTSKIDEELEDLKPRLISLHRKRDDCKETLLSKHKMSYSQIEKLLQDVSFLLDCEPPNLTTYLLSVPMVWDPHRWMTIQSKKEAANRLILSALAHLKVEERNGVFLIRPSHSRAGCFALSISMDAQVHSCLIEYREPRSSISGIDFCGFAFLNTNIYFVCPKYLQSKIESRQTQGRIEPMFFSTLVDFVRYYSKVSLKEHNNQLDTCLSIPALLWAGA